MLTEHPWHWEEHLTLGGHQVSTCGMYITAPGSCVLLHSPTLASAREGWLFVPVPDTPTALASAMLLSPFTLKIALTWKIT